MQGGQNKKSSSPRRSQVLPSTPIYPRISTRGISREHLHQLLVELSAEQTDTSPNNQHQLDSRLSEEMKRIVIEICDKIVDTEKGSDFATEPSGHSPRVTPFIIHVSEEESSYSEFDESDNEIENMLQELLDEGLVDSDPISQKPKFYIKRSENNINFDENRYLFSRNEKNHLEDETEEENETILNIIEPEYAFTEEDSENELLFELEDPYPELSASRKEGVYWSSVGLVKDFRGLQNGLDLISEQKRPGVMGDSGKANSMKVGKEMNLSGDSITRVEDQNPSKMTKCCEKGKKNPIKIWNRFINIFKSKR